MEKYDPAPEDVRAALDRVLASSSLSRTTSLAALLRYVVESALAGRGADIKEYTIALEVFGRKEYDPQVNSHVRVEFSKLRKRLSEYYSGEGANDPVQIEIPKGSYVPRFIATAMPVPPDVAPTGNRRKRWAAAAVLIVIAVTAAVAAVIFRSRQPAHASGTLAIAVLPFQDVSTAVSADTLCHALTADVTTRLARLEAMRVSSPTLVAQRGRRREDSSRLEKQLDVQALVEGTLRSEAGRVQANVQFTDARSGFTLWAATFEQPTGTDAVPALAAEIVRSVQLELKPVRRALVRPHSENDAARTYYLRAARAAYMQPLKAVELYQAAVAADPTYALAWASLAVNLITSADWGDARPADVFPRSAKAAQRALALNPELTEAHQALGRVKVFAEYDWEQAESAFRRAIELDAANVEARFDYANLVLIPRARFEDAVAQLEAAIALNPGENTLHNTLASAYIKARRYDEAARPLEASQKISATAPGAWVLRGIAASAKGATEEAIKCFETAARRRTPFTLSHLAHTYAQSRRTEEAKRIIEELEQVPPGKPSHDYEVAMIYAGLGDKDAAFSSLARALANRGQGLLWVKVDYRADPLREDPRMQTVLKRLRLE